MADKKRDYPSGASKRKKKLDAAEAQNAPADARAKKKEQRLEQQERRDYASAGKPPEDVVGRMVWAQGLTAKAIYWTGKWAGTPTLCAGRRTILEGGAKLGMTAVKALYEERLVKLEKRIYGRRKDSADVADGTEEYKPPEAGPATGA